MPRKRRQARREERQAGRGGGAAPTSGGEQTTGAAGPRGGAATPTRYQMRQKLLSIGDDYFIETADGRRAFKVDGKALRVRNTIVIRGLQGQEQYRIQERMVRVKQTMVIERGRQTVATIQKALVTPLRDRFAVDVVGGAPLTVRGNVLDHEYTITRNGTVVATVSKRWFRIRDTYGVEIMPGEDHAFVLAVTAAFDSI